MRRKCMLAYLHLYFSDGRGHEYALRTLFENLQAQSMHVGSHESFAGLAEGVWILWSRGELIETTISEIPTLPSYHDRSADFNLS